MYSVTVYSNITVIFLPQRPGQDLRGVVHDVYDVCGATGFSRWHAFVASVEEA